MGAVKDRLLSIKDLEQENENLNAAAMGLNRTIRSLKRRIAELENIVLSFKRNRK